MFGIRVLPVEFLHSACINSFVMNEYSSEPIKSFTNTNVNTSERLLSILSGYYLLRSAVANKSWLRALLGGFLMYRGGSGHCPVVESIEHSRASDPVRIINLRTRMIVNRPRNEVYAFWRRLGNLPRFMKHLESVSELDKKRSSWRAKIPGGIGVIEWDAEVVKEEEGQFLGWQSLPGSMITNAGKVEFRDAGEGATELAVVISYEAPLGAAGEAVSRALTPLFKQMIRADLEGFREYAEGEHEEWPDSHKVW